MNLSLTRRLQRINIDYRVLGFFIPFAFMLVTMLLRQTEPFGDRYSMLYSDMYHQYYPFFVSFREALRSGKSLLYSWNVGMGMDYLGLISYYLASPLNLISLILPESWTLEYFSLLMPIKLGFAGLFFAIFLNKAFKRNDISIALFGSFYALCAWALGYQWNIMWLDTFALLPLVITGTLALLTERKFILYTFSLFLSVFTNYYIGFFTCIFVLLFFICYQICRWRNFVRFLSDLMCMGIFSALALGMTAVLTLPAFEALQTTQSAVNKFPQKLAFNIVDEDTFAGFWDAMRQVAGNMNGGLEPTFKEGLPNLYCGVGTTFLAVLFLTCRQIKLRDKICSIFLLLLFAASFIIRQLDYIWHGFHFPNMIPYRFSFLFSFVMLVMAYRAYLLRNRFRPWQLTVAGICCIGIILCANDLTNPAYWIYNGVFLILYICAFAFLQVRKKLPESQNHKDRQDHLQQQIFRRQLIAYSFAGIMALELILNLANFSITFPSTGVSNYPTGTTYAASVIRYMKQREEDTLFYRTEVTRSQTLNDGAINNYNGISAFTSSANVNVTKFLKALGYGAKDTYNRYRFEESSPVSNLFLDLKYMIDRDGYVAPNSYFDIRNTFGDVTLLENNAYLPLGFLTNAQLVNVDFSNVSNPLMFQNTLLQAASGITDNAWSLITGNNISISATDAVTLTSKTKTGYCAYNTQGQAGSVSYTYVIDRPGFMCVSLHFSQQNKFNIYLNGIAQETTGSEGTYGRSYSLPLTVAVGDVTPGDIVEIKLQCEADKNGSARVYAGVLDEEIFRNAYDALAQSTLQLTAFEDTHIEGTIHCNRNGVLYTSIPQNGNWIATVDGKPAQTVKIGDAMLGLLLSEGNHTITFTYHNKAFSFGWKISLLCVIIVAAFYCFTYHPLRKRKGKYQR